MASVRFPVKLETWNSGHKWRDRRASSSTVTRKKERMEERKAMCRFGPAKLPR